MICKNCGNQIDDNQKFCGVCGAKVEPIDVFSSTPGVQPVMPEPEIEPEMPVNSGFTVQPSETDAGLDPDFFAPEPEKKSKKGLVIAIIVVAALLVLGGLGFIFRDTLSAVWMHLMPAEKQLQYTYYRATAQTSQDFVDTYRESMDMYEKGYAAESDMSLEITGETKDMVEEYLGVSLGDANKINISVRSDLQDSKCAYTGNLSIDSTKILDFALYYDYTDNSMVFDVPGLLESPVKVDMAEQSGVDYSEAMSELDVEMTELLDKLMPDDQLLEKLLPRLVEVAFAQITDVEKEGEEFSAGGVDQKATCLTAEISEETVADMCIAIVEELQENKDFNAYIEKLADNLELLSEDLTGEEVDGDDVIDAVEDALKELKRNLKDLDYSDDAIVVINTYVDFHYNIIGLEVEVPDADVEVTLGSAEKGSDYGFIFAVKNQGTTYIEISGTGTKKGGKLTADYDINAALNGAELSNLAIIKVADWELDAEKNGVNGSVEICLGDDAGYLFNISELDLVSPSIKFDFVTADGENSNITMSVNVQGVSVLTFSVSSTLSYDPVINVPENAIDYDDAQINEDFGDELIEKIEDAGLPISDIIDLLEELSYALGGSESYTDSYYDYDYDYDYDYNYSYDDYYGYTY